MVDSWGGDGRGMGKDGRCMMEDGMMYDGLGNSDGQWLIAGVDQQTLAAH